MSSYKKSTVAIAMSILALTFQGCYYDVEEELYPNAGFCDTSAVTYSLTVKPILDANCIVCHSTASNQGNVILDSHTEAKQYAESGQLLGAIKHEPGFSPMPQGGNKLNACNISKIEIWVNAGTPNN
jgi:hypothetical protein